MYPLRRGSPAGSNQSFEVEVRPVADQVNRQPSLAILGEVSENPEPEADQNGSAIHDRSGKPNEYKEGLYFKYSYTLVSLNSLYSIFRYR